MNIKRVGNEFQQKQQIAPHCECKASTASRPINNNKMFLAKHKCLGGGCCCAPKELFCKLIQTNGNGFISVVQ